MKCNVSRWMKRSLAFMMAAILIAGGSLVVPTETKAAAKSVATTNEVRYVEYPVEDCTLGQAPKYSGVDQNYGYLFAGWYKINSNNKYAVIANQNAKPASGSVYAKFVPAYVLSIKCQNFVGTGIHSKEAKLRIISSLDGKNYRQVGFDLMKITKKADGTFKTMKVMGTDGGQTTTDMYQQFSVYKSADDLTPTVFTGQEMFGPASKYLTAWQINDIQKDDFGTIYCIRPYWVTPDYAKVYGLVKYAHIEDGLQEYINVPVNLNNAEDVVAGLANVTYDTRYLEFVDVECGRVFEEMEFHVEITDDGTGTVYCVGNRENILKNTESDDIYVNIRFKAASTEASEGVLNEKVNNFDFEVNDENFGNTQETTFDDTQYKVWKVKTAILKAVNAEGDTGTGGAGN